MLLVEPGTYEAYRDSLRRKGMVLNQIKPVVVLNTPERQAFFLSRVQTPSSAVDAWRAQQEVEKR